MSSINKDTLLALWLENQLTDEQRGLFEQLCITDSEFAQSVETATLFSNKASDYKVTATPNWQPERLFPTQNKKPWWQWSGLPVASMASSFAAILMVVTGVNVDYSDSKLSIQFGHGPSEHEVASLLEQRMTEFAQTQRNTLSDYIELAQQQQVQTNTQLTNYLLASSRQERREDFAELIKFVNEQRSDDQIFYARQLNSLQQELSLGNSQNWPTDAGNQINE